MWRQVHRWRSRFCHNFFFLLFLHPLRHRFDAAYQAGILSAESGAEMADVEQLKKIVPFVTCEITFGQNVCELMLGINESNLNYRHKIYPVKTTNPKQLCWFLITCLIVGLRPFYNHVNHGFIVLKDIQHSIGTRMCSAWWNVINVGQIEISVRGWNLFFACLVECLPTSFTVALLHHWFCWFGLVRNDILQSHRKDRERESHPCVNLHREISLQLP